MEDTTSTQDQQDVQRFSGQLKAPITDAMAQSDNAIVPAKPPPVVKRIIGQQVPIDILENQALNDAIAILPANYSFEIHKTVWRIRQAGAKRVALQFPEGLLLYSCVIADILESFAGVEATFIMGDVTFGACCVDDYSASALGADFLVHYGHSCLVPVDITSLPCMYVFVDIKLDIDHLIATVQHNFESPDTRLVLAGTIQFAASIQAAYRALSAYYTHPITIPQSKPLSPGEVLGCTAPILNSTVDYDAIVFVADGRFHLEALMIANPKIPAYRYDPYGRLFTREEYDHDGMRFARRAAIEAAKTATSWGVVLGTLGRQGNPAILTSLQRVLEEQNKRHVIVLLSEVSPIKLTTMSQGIDAWIQIACPRLSIDWGDEFKKPTLNPYEAFVALGQVSGWWESSSDDSTYPMDYYSSEGGAWSSTYHRAKPRGAGRPGAAALAAAARERAKQAASNSTAV